MFSNTFHFIEKASLDNLTNELKKYGVIFNEETNCEEPFKNFHDFEYITSQNYSCLLDFEHLCCVVQARLIGVKYDFIASSKMAICKLLSEEMIKAA